MATKRDTSKLTLRQAQSEFTLMMAKLVIYAYEHGYELTCGEAYRSNEQAAINALGKVGRNALMVHLERDARFLMLAGALQDNVGDGTPVSAHTQRLAIDFMLFKNGTYLTASEDYLALGEYWESIGGSWGGRFRNKDGNHFSLNYRGVE